MRSLLPWLACRKLRPALGIPVAFTLMSGVALGVVNLQLAAAAIGLLFIDLFGNFYNDYCDYDEDAKAKRIDKFTVSGKLGRRRCLTLSVVFLLAGVSALSFAGIAVFSVGMALALLLFLYSHRDVRLKGKLWGYMMSFPYFFLPVAMALQAGAPVLAALPLGLFFYMQCIYILCQKDATDVGEKDNIFGGNSARAYQATLIFATISSLSLLVIVLGAPYVAAGFALSVFSKGLNLRGIRKETLSRPQRSRNMLMEFASHYASVGGVAI